MANVHILYDYPSDDGTYGSTGSWVASLPLSNLVNRHLSSKARSTDALTDNTRFSVDLLTARPVSAFALLGHNLSSSATIQIIVSNNSDGSSPLLDVTVNALAATIPYGALPWGDFPWDGFDPDLADEFPEGLHFYYLAAASVTGRYVLIRITDTGNSDGYVQAGRFIADDPFVPTYNMGFGASLRWIDDSKVSRSKGGQLYVDELPKRRQLDLTLGWLSEAEAYGAIYDIQRKVGLGGDCLVIYDPEDGQQVGFRRTIYGALSSIAPIVTEGVHDFPYSTTLSIEERF